MDLDEIDDTILFGMASGSFIPRHTLEEVGLMREEFWIDYIDYEFSFRVRERGYRIIGVGGAFEPSPWYKEPIKNSRKSVFFSGSSSL